MTSYIMPKLKLRTFIIVLTMSVLMVLVGAVVIPLSFEALMNLVFDKMMVISPSSAIYTEWENPTLPIYTKFYFFDIKNQQEVLEGEKPFFEEIGPYSYRMLLPRENVTFNPNSTVSSLQPYTYIFDRAESVGSENDTFLTTNMVYWTVVYFMGDASSAIKKLINDVFETENEKPFIRLSVKDLIWGYDEPFFTLIHELLPWFPLPEGFETQFGFLLGRNNTSLGLYTSFTGVKNKTRVNQIDRFDGETQLDYWKSDYANAIDGTDGMMYHRGIKEDEVLNLFHPDLCRTMPYTYRKDEKLKDVPLKRFTVASWAYANGSTYPPNEGFDIGNESIPMGLQRVDPCKFGAPIALSNPHFYNADPSLIDAVFGMNPDEDTHSNYFSIEPILGMPFKLRMRLQINQYMISDPEIESSGNVNVLYMPAFWFEEDVTANDEIIGYYNLGVKLTSIISLVLQYLFICIGASLFISFSLVVIIKRVRTNTKDITTETGGYISTDGERILNTEMDPDE